VTHDLGVIADVCDRVAVMYAGQIVEEASVDALFARPQHPYTEGLLGAMPQVGEREERLTVIRGRVPLPHEMPSGCRFAARCDYANDVCTALRGWAQDVRDSQTELQKKSTQGASLETDRDSLQQFVDDAVAATDDLKQEVEDAGAPDIDGGDDVANAFQEAVDDTSDKLDEARDSVSQIPADNPADYRADNPSANPAASPNLAHSCAAESS